MNSDAANNHETPIVSIGLPVYNGSRYLRMAIQSVVDQTFDSWELLISDNCSEDSTDQIIKEFEEKYPRIRSVRQNVNMGALCNFAYCFENARAGRYFMWLSSDDALMPDFLMRTVELLDTDPAAVLACPLQRRIDKHGDTAYQAITAEQHVGFLSLNTEPRRASRVIRVATIVCSCGTTLFEGLMRRSVLERLPPFRDNMSDVMMLIELAWLGPFAICPEVLFLRREHSESNARKSPGLNAYKNYLHYIGDSGMRLGMGRIDIAATRLLVTYSHIHPWLKRIVAYILTRAAS